MRAGVDHRIHLVLMRQMQIGRIAIEAELQHAHARQCEVPAQRRRPPA